MTFLVAIVVTLAGRKPAPGHNQLIVQLDNEWQTYDVDSAYYGIHMEGNACFLTVVCSASSDPPIDPPECKLEFSIPYDKNPKPIIVQGAKLDLPVYDEKYGNLNYFRFFGFDDIDDGVFTIRSSRESEIDGVLEADGGTMMLRARFLKQDNIARSFD